MKRIILLIAFCLSLSAIYAQTIDIIHLKNGFDARGTITNRTESQITLQSENGRTLTIDISEIESMEQGQKAFDPRVLIGRWACYDANGARNERYDVEINENEGYYTARYNKLLFYKTNKDKPKLFPEDPDDFLVANKDLDVETGMVSYHFFQRENCIMNANKKQKIVEMLFEYSCDVELKYEDGKLRGTINCLRYYCAVGCYGLTLNESLQKGCGDILADGPGDKWKVYFVKY